MKLPIFILVAYLGTLVAARGRRACTERLWLWYAYQIDLLNPPADRIMGYRCLPFIRETNTCPGDAWEACAGTQTAPGKVGSCTFRELMTFLGPGNFPPNIAQGGDPRTLTPDIEATSTEIHRRNLDRQYAPYRIVRGSPTAFNVMCEMVGRQIGRTRLRLTADQLAANQVFFDRQETALDRVRVLRQIDHSRHLGPDLENGLAKYGFRTWYTAYGTDPVLHTPWNMVDLEVSFAENWHIFDVRTKAQDFLNIHYSDQAGGNEQAHDHKVVMDSFSVAGNMANGIGCGAF